MHRSKIERERNTWTKYACEPFRASSGCVHTTPSLRRSSGCCLKHGRFVHLLQRNLLICFDTLKNILGTRNPPKRMLNNRVQNCLILLSWKINSRHQNSTLSPETTVLCGQPHSYHNSWQDGTFLASEGVWRWCCECWINERAQYYHRVSCNICEKEQGLHKTTPTGLPKSFSWHVYSVEKMFYSKHCSLTQT